jgi:hypothetical protein
LIAHNLLLQPVQPNMAIIYTIIRCIREPAHQRLVDFVASFLALQRCAEVTFARVRARHKMVSESHLQTLSSEESTHKQTTQEHLIHVCTVYYHQY